MKTMKKFAAAGAACIALTAVAPAFPVPAQTAVSLTAYAADEKPVKVTEGALTFSQYSDHAEVIKCSEEAETVEIPAKLKELHFPEGVYVPWRACRSSASAHLPRPV